MATDLRTFTIASRASELAQVQTNIVRDALAKLYPEHAFATSFMTTGGDHNQSQAIYLIGGKEMWTKELEVALREGAVDMLVHSYKDVPTALPAGCAIAGVLERENPVDSLIVKEGLSYKSLEELPDGSVVGTSSVRRVAQLKRRFPKLVFQDVRGNLNTRMKKLDAPDSPFAAIILAKAGMVRLGWGARITRDLAPPLLLPAVSQGALAIEVRADDAAARALCAAISHWPTAWACAAERACLRVLEGGCSVPVGVHSALAEAAGADGRKGGRMSLTGAVTSLEGERHVEHTESGEVWSEEEAEALGARLAGVLMGAGAKAILEDIAADKARRVKEAEAAEATV
ncbi:porphobilinogen deaminase [Epithele typhae]|uniref:porphobilinogen deaminase n=1 Tax=Epithele typhae TaxID=378194 RepID=UPI002007F2F1|nr:porphobilinogen deaminase [Epithele typhae]KAH9910898.1 porphobilinogen deaminase [Epithele typhae]